MNPGLVDIDGKDIITCFDIAWTQVYHAGVDLYHANGTDEAGDEVTAVANGKVVFAKAENYPGSVVIIKHNDPFNDPNNPKPIYSVYGHLNDDSIVVHEGDFVSRGTSLGNG